MRVKEDAVSKRPVAIELLTLWPTFFLKQALSDFELHNQRLSSLAHAKPMANVFEISDGSVEWLKSHVAQGIDAFLRKSGLAGPLNCTARGRFELQTVSDLTTLCNRPGAYFTGLYIVQHPDPDPDIGKRSDRRPGCITFYDGRAGMNMNAIERDPYSFYHYTMELVTGSLLMWPAYVTYYIHPNLSRDTAIRVAFDVHVQPDSSPA